MSLILEALRKSEAERRRGASPDVAVELPPAPAARGRAVPAWVPPAIAAALALAIWLLGGTVVALLVSLPEVIAAAHPGREVVPVDARALIWQNGSVHCLTMQLPAGLLDAAVPPPG